MNVILVLLCACIYGTFQMACPFTLKIGTNGEGTKLIVKELNETHNHDIAQVTCSIFCYVFNMELCVVVVVFVFLYIV